MGKRLDQMVEVIRAANAYIRRNDLILMVSRPIYADLVVECGAPDFPENFTIRGAEVAMVLRDDDFHTVVAHPGNKHTASEMRAAENPPIDGVEDKEGNRVAWWVRPPDPLKQRSDLNDGKEEQA